MHPDGLKINYLLALGILIIIGYLGGMVARKVKFPRISGYIFVGMFLGPSFINIISKDLLHGGLKMVTNQGGDFVRFGQVFGDLAVVNTQVIDPTAKRPRSLLAADAQCSRILNRAC